MVLDYEEMVNEMVNDLQQNFGYSEDEALEWVEEHGDYVVNDMWNAYSHYMEEFAEYKGE